METQFSGRKLAVSGHESTHHDNYRRTGSNEDAPGAHLIWLWTTTTTSGFLTGGFVV